MDMESIDELSGHQYFLVASHLSDKLEHVQVRGQLSSALSTPFRPLRATSGSLDDQSIRSSFQPRSVYNFMAFPFVINKRGWSSGAHVPV